MFNLQGSIGEKVTTVLFGDTQNNISQRLVQFIFIGCVPYIEVSTKLTVLTVDDMSVIGFIESARSESHQFPENNPI